MSANQVIEAMTGFRGRPRSSPLLTAAPVVLAASLSVPVGPAVACQPAHLPGAGSLRAAIQDLRATAGAGYPAGDRYLARLEDIELRAARGDPPGERLVAELEALRLEALAANPLVSGQPLIFVTRPQYALDHHNTATLFQTGEINAHKFEGGGALKMIDLGRGGGVTTLLEAPEGIIRDLEVSFDGQRILFSMRRSAADEYHIYELRVGQPEARQLTAGSGLSDIDPVYLPDGTIVFSSTREPKLCQCNRHIMANLFRMDADGSRIHQIGRNALFEGHPALLGDGLILYDRWEYVDRHFGPSFSLWTTRPDGSTQTLVFGNNAWSPGMIADARPVPGTGLLIATYGSCHDRPWGALALIDPGLGSDGKGPVTRIWPASARDLITNRGDYGRGMSRGHPTGGQIDNFKRVQPKYEDPYPLSDRHFLCSRSIGGEAMGLFLLDLFGNEVRLHHEEPGCYDPMPLARRRRPQPIPDRTDPVGTEGVFYVLDVYRGSGMESIQRGTIRWLRVVEVPPKLFWTDPNWNLDATQAPAMNWNCTVNKRILGTVPVEADGSAYFRAPADRFVYFQLLDELGRMVQSMRSGTTARPGELVGCVGCHEDRQRAAPGGTQALALRRAPSQLRPWYGPERDFNYLTEVQPVLDRHCVSCHDHGRPAGEVLNLSGDLGLAFNTSYVELRRRSALRWFPDQDGDQKLLVKAVDDGPPEVLGPMAWGSHRSRLVDVMLGDHHDVRLSREEIDRVVTWIDLNAPYYGSYASAYPENAFGRSPLDDARLRRLRELTGVELGTTDSELSGSQVNFTRPELSPCLGGLAGPDDPRHREALNIIRHGRDILASRPRADMPGFRISGIDCDRLEKYRTLRSAEQAARRALAGTGSPEQADDPTAGVLETRRRSDRRR